MQSEFPVDLVVTYVDNTDSVWQAAISQYDTEIDPKRYRSWDIFHYWFRGVEKNMPFIRTVHLVVSNIEQVPKWLDQSKVHVVLHKDIIPEKLLPTFNSTTIEMYLYRIPGLAEHFIYSNDDMMPVNPMTVGDFFRDGLPIYQLIEKTNSRNVFRMQCRNSYRLASELAHHPIQGLKYFYIKHSMDPMLKSVCEEVHQKAGQKIQGLCTKFREPFNYTQYLFPDYGYLTSRGVLGKYSFVYANLGNLSYSCQLLKSNSIRIVCINDSGKVKDFELAKQMVTQTLDQRFPDKSGFENQ